MTRAQTYQPIDWSWAEPAQRSRLHHKPFAAQIMYITDAIASVLECVERRCEASKRAEVRPVTGHPSHYEIYQKLLKIYGVTEGEFTRQQPRESSVSITKRSRMVITAIMRAYCIGDKPLSWNQLTQLLRMNAHTTLLARLHAWANNDAAFLEALQLVQKLQLGYATEENLNKLRTEFAKPKA